MERHISGRSLALRIQGVIGLTGLRAGIEKLTDTHFAPGMGGRLSDPRTPISTEGSRSRSGHGQWSSVWRRPGMPDASPRKDTMRATVTIDDDKLTPFRAAATALGRCAQATAAGAALLGLLAGCGSTSPASGPGVAAPLAPSSSSTLTSTSPTVTSSPTSAVIVDPAGGGLHACALVTQDEAGRAMGVAAPAPRETPNGETCTYVSGSSALVIKIAPSAEITGHDPQRALQAIAQQHGGRPASGSAATLVYDDSHTGKSVAYVTHDALVIIGLTGPSVADATLAQLASIAQARW